MGVPERFNVLVRCEGMVGIVSVGGVDREVYDAVRKFVEAYAKAKGYALNPDPDKLQAVIEGLARNQVMYGYRYCPCRLLSGNPEEDAKKVCPCAWHAEEIEKDGRCHCGLFWKASSNKPVGADDVK